MRRVVSRLEDNDIPTKTFQEGRTMRTAVYLFSVAALSLAACGSDAAWGQIVNGSFEDDGYIGRIGQIDPNIPPTDPNGWTANMPAGKFTGSVDMGWATEGMYSLTLYSECVPFDPCDMAVVSQQVVLADVDEILFDVKLAGQWTAWDPSICSAVVLIDGDVVWTSDTLEPNDTGEYFSQVCPIDDKYRTLGTHELSLGLRINVSEWLWKHYYARWDFIEALVFCGGGGLLPGDFNRDCFVDVNDLMAMATVWLDEVAADSLYNLSGVDDDGENPVGTVNFFDLAVLGGSWRDTSLTP
jgi:hypothetical protein